MAISTDLEKGEPPNDVTKPLSLRLSHGHEEDLQTVETPTRLAGFGIPLYSYRAIPSFLKGNPYITDGYRAHLTPEMCAKSAFICSNETVNIWSHVIGLVYFTLLQFQDNVTFLPLHKADYDDHFTFTVMNLAFQICMFCSAGYHMFACQSEMASRRWLGLDLAGVSVGLCGCYFPGAYYAFYCNQFWQSVYVLVMLSLAVASLFAQAHPSFLSNHWYMRRLVLYSCVVFAGVVPVVHWILLSGGFDKPFVLLFLPKVAVMYLFAMIGGFFYVSKFPENLCPGKLNFIGSSHQWWHLVVLISFMYAHHMGEVVFIYWKSHDCHMTYESSPS